jgi:DNA-binding NarL/FixJ family response regulator
MYNQFTKNIILSIALLQLRIDIKLLNLLEIMNTILVVESIPLLRCMLCQLMSNIPNINTNILAVEYEALTPTLSLKPDWIWLDGTNPIIKKSNYLKNLKKSNENIKIIIFGHNDSISDIYSYYQQGIIGYLPKTSEQKDILEMIYQIAEGKIFMPTTLLQCINSWTQPPAPKRHKYQLTSREKEVLNLIVEEYSTKEIADKLFVSPCTIETHRLNLIQKMEVKNTAGLVRKAIQERLWGDWKF